MSWWLWRKPWEAYKYNWDSWEKDDNFYFKLIILSPGRKTLQQLKVKNGTCIMIKYDTEKVTIMVKYDQIFK